MTTPWTLVGAPLDSSGRDRGDARGVAALREHGLAEALGARDGGDLDVAITDPSRDVATGVVGYRQVEAATRVLRAAVAELLGAGERPLVVGGDCTLVPGALAGARDHAGRLGLAFVDGHVDALDGRSSPTGEAADMDLAIVTGHGPEALAGATGGAIIVAPRDVVVVGPRGDAPADVALPRGGAVVEADVLDPAVTLIDAETALARGPGEVGAEIARRIAPDGRGAWLHIDLDVLDEDVMPAVSYPQPDGLEWDDLEELLAPLVAMPRLLGADVTCLNPDLDPDGRCATRAVEVLGRALGRVRAPAGAGR